MLYRGQQVQVELPLDFVVNDQLSDSPYPTVFLADTVTV